MRRAFLLLPAIVLLMAFGPQGPTFSLTDKKVEIGAIYILKASFAEYSHDLDDALEQELDALSKFLDANPTVKVEIGVHIEKDNEEILTAERASKLEKYLLRKNIKKSRISAIGYGNKRPMITARDLFKLKTLEDKANAKRKNTRIEVRIASVE
ncbi:MAG: OmpA family protein [Flammeovirgaceae bacterium]